ncbi:probable dolichyl pyrophosphate Glc1Man9GlcNAc2 alpha-1,3-glucosyltransferase [Cimex lectularius]|uniref:Alpha-1,3-glucosyltransferase n=1 Tax=Cimex lectularius TaxID=79782 RepID=A0A8I6RH37_CIMLE|nr:probable dolichyl pyrophosphate Glc1Man9GlcNAc2 alpha-1,3-glucosyltransferase [Cimex lectularius]
MFMIIVGLASCIKILLMASYKSTDFEVHRNWLAITYNLPMKKWYVDNTSEWTLDYPPFFAWFEYFLSQFAAFVNPKMLELTNLNYSSTSAVVFQRMTVIISDLVLAVGTKRLSTYLSNHPKKKCSKKKSKWRSPSTIFELLVLVNVGLLIVDHMHFQYNGVLLGILLISISYVLSDEHLLGAFWFTFLLNMKHIFLYMAPAYGIYLLKNYCVTYKQGKFCIKSTAVQLMKLGSVVLGVTFLSFGPFILMGQVEKVIARLFPFKRGLCHAYWAPNFWALYNLVDKIAAMIGKFLGYNIEISHGKMTGGLVQEYDHSVLPSITPWITMVCTIVSIIPCLWKLWTNPGNPLHFVRSLILCSGCAFLFGWHVHEKAILMVIIPQSILAVLWRKEAEVFIMLSTVGHYALLPLIFTPTESFIKVLMFVSYSYFVFTILLDLFQAESSKFTLSLLSPVETVYMYGLMALFLYEHFLHKWLTLNKYPFLPLMLTSCYCAVGIIYSIVRYYRTFLLMSDNRYKQKTF